MAALPEAEVLDDVLLATQRARSQHAEASTRQAQVEAARTATTRLVAERGLSPENPAPLVARAIAAGCATSACWPPSAPFPEPASSHPPTPPRPTSTSRCRSGMPRPRSSRRSWRRCSSRSGCAARRPSSRSTSGRLPVGPARAPRPARLGGRAVGRARLGRRRHPGTSRRAHRPGRRRRRHPGARRARSLRRRGRVGGLPERAVAARGAARPRWPPRAADRPWGPRGGRRLREARRLAHPGDVSHPCTPRVPARRPRPRGGGASGTLKRSPRRSTQASTSRATKRNWSGSPVRAQRATSAGVTGVDTVGSGRARNE